MQVSNKKRGLELASSSPPFKSVRKTHQGRPAETTVAQTPASNTGLNSHPAFSVGLDWLDITFRKTPGLKEIETILSEVEALTGDSIDFCASRATYQGRAWHGSGRGVKGTLIFYDAGNTEPEAPERPEQLKISMSGRVVSAIDQKALAYWLHGRSESNELDCTRIDIALDDHEKFISLRKIAQARKKGNFFNASHSGLHISNKRGDTEGESYYFGAPQSDKHLIIYNKSVESNNRIEGNRWEARFKRKSARVALYEWISAAIESDARRARWCQDTVLGVIDFRSRGHNDPNRARCPQLGWFRNFIKRLSACPARIRAIAEKPTIQRSIDWVCKSVAPSLSLIKKALDTDFEEFLDNIIIEGGSRISIARRKLLLMEKKQQLIY